MQRRTKPCAQIRKDSASFTRTVHHLRLMPTDRTPSAADAKIKELVRSGVMESRGFGSAEVRRFSPVNSFGRGSLGSHGRYQSC
jgi:hypothetical protein